MDPVQRVWGKRWRRQHAVSSARRLPGRIDHKGTANSTFIPSVLVSSFRVSGASQGFALKGWDERSLRSMCSRVERWTQPQAVNVVANYAGPLPSSSIAMMYPMVNPRGSTGVSSIGEDWHLPPTALPKSSPRREGAEEASVWSSGIGSLARVIALSVAKQKKRELLSDRKGPYTHLTPLKLSMTAVKSGIIVGLPLVNDIILEGVGSETDQQDAQDPSLRGGFFPAIGNEPSRVMPYQVIDSEGNLRLVHPDQRSPAAETKDEDDDIMAVLARTFKSWPYLTLRKTVQNVLIVSTMRLLEWQAVVHLSLSMADKLTKNITLSAIRKRQRMSVWMASAKMMSTASRATAVNYLSVFLVDELFLIASILHRERSKRKDPRYRPDRDAILMELRANSMSNAYTALSLWVAATVGAMVGTMIHPKRSVELMMQLAELGANALLVR